MPSVACGACHGAARFSPPSSTPTARCVRDGPPPQLGRHILRAARRSAGDRAHGAGTPDVAVGLAVITGIAGLGGSPQIALLFVSVWLAYSLFRLTWTWREAGRTPALELGAWLLASVALGLALGAVRFLPTIETTALSGRAGGWNTPPRQPARSRPGTWCLATSTRRSRFRGCSTRR